MLAIRWLEITPDSYLQWGSATWQEDQEGEAMREDVAFIDDEGVAPDARYASDNEGSMGDAPQVSDSWRGGAGCGRKGRGWWGRTEKGKSNGKSLAKVCVGQEEERVGERAM